MSSYLFTIIIPLSPLPLQNLDVNQALNNLLSREDDDDDAHEEGSGVVGLNIPSGGVEKTMR